MRKTGLDLDGVRALLYQTTKSAGWALCVGAGTSIPIYPSWQQLVATLIADLDKLKDGGPRAAELLAEFPPDAVIQGVMNKCGLKDEAFAHTLGDAVHGNLQGKLDPEEWSAVSSILARPGKKGVSKKTWRTFLECFEKKLPSTTALGIARALTPVLGTSLQPTAILSFNAEAMLFGLLNAMSWRRDTDDGRKQPKTGENRQLLNAVTRGISRRQPGRVPFIFCHGFLPVPTTHKIAPLVSVDKLVFCESAYLQLAGGGFAWQSSAFLDTCSSRTVVFVGVSLADPNMRRWLSWIHENRAREIEATAPTASPQSQHFWIRVRPTDPSVESWIESTVEHLGVRLVWIDSWGEVEMVLARMLKKKAV